MIKISVTKLRKGTPHFISAQNILNQDAENICILSISGFTQDPFLASDDNTINLDSYTFKNNLHMLAIFLY